MNKKQRNKNLQTAKDLHWVVREKTAPICENCGEKGLHWIQMPQSIEDILFGNVPVGFWTCSKYYGEDGRRIGT